MNNQILGIKELKEYQEVNNGSTHTSASNNKIALIKSPSLSFFSPSSNGFGWSMSGLSSSKVYSCKDVLQSGNYHKLVTSLSWWLNNTTYPNFPSFFFFRFAATKASFTIELRFPKWTPSSVKLTLFTVASLWLYQEWASSPSRLKQKATNTNNIMAE